MKNIWKPILAQAVMFGIFLLCGNVKWAILSQGLLPILCMLSDVSAPFTAQGRRVRQIQHNMTEDEKQRCVGLVKSYGRKAGLFFGISWPLTFGVLFHVLDIRDYGYHVLALLVLYAIEHSFLTQHRRAIMTFAFSTRYAKERGWSMGNGMREGS